MMRYLLFIATLVAVVPQEMAFCQENSTQKQISETATRFYLDLYDDYRNRIGLMRYCRDKSLLDKASAERAAEDYRRKIDSLYPEGGSRPFNRVSGDIAEKAGDNGVIHSNDWQGITKYSEGKHKPITFTFDEFAKIKGGTPADLCKRYVSETAVR